MPRLPAITLVSALLLALSIFHTLPTAHALHPIGADRMIRRYTHNLHYRQTLDDIIPDGEQDPPAGGSSAAGGGATQSNPAPTATRGGGGIIGGIGTAIGGGATPTQTRTTTTDAPESSTTERSTSTRAPDTPTRAPTTPPPQQSSTTAPPQTTLTRIVWDDATPEQQQEIKENREYQSSLSRIPENVRTILIVVASVLAALIIIWTAVRKWKLRSSQSFQSRLAPIDWQPDNDKDKLAPPQAPMGEISDKDSIRRNMFAPDGPSLAPPPHDFTAGAGSYSRSASPMPYGAHTASPVPFRTDSPAPGGLQRYPSNGSSGRGYEPAAYRGY